MNAAQPKKYTYIWAPSHYKDGHPRYGNFHYNDKTVIFISPLPHGGVLCLNRNQIYYNMGLNIMTDIQQYDFILIQWHTSHIDNAMIIISSLWYDLCHEWCN